MLTCGASDSSSSDGRSEDVEDSNIEGHDEDEDADCSNTEEDEGARYLKSMFVFANLIKHLQRKSIARRIDYGMGP